MTQTAAVPAKAYCNCVAQERGLDPVGHAASFTDAIVIEMPLPWKRDLYGTDSDLPKSLRRLLGLWMQRYTETGAYPHLPLFVASDDRYSRPGFRRVMLYTRPNRPFARFDKTEYVIPDEELGPLVWALYEDHDALPGLEQYRMPDADQIRDVLVCTHGTVDAACARFGYPVYKHLRDARVGEHLRVWRVSHFGGHVFAPTLIDMPTGHFWAYVGREQAAQIIGRTGDVAALRGHYRGWAGVENGFEQAAEFDLWQKHGWAWFDHVKHASTVDREASCDDTCWADVQINFAAPDERAMVAVMSRVEIYGTVETIVTTGQDHVYAHPQYRVCHSKTID